MNVSLSNQWRLHILMLARIETNSYPNDLLRDLIWGKLLVAWLDLLLNVAE